MIEKKKRFHINWVDIVIIVVVLALAAAALLLRNKVAGDEQQETYTMRFTAEAQKLLPEVADSFKVGEDIYDSSTNEYLGKLVSINKKPYHYVVYSETAGKFTDCDDPLTMTLEMVIEGQGHADERTIRMENKVLQIGATVYLKGKGHAATAYVVGIDTMEAPVPVYSNMGSGDKQITYQILVPDVRDMTVNSFKVGDTLYEKGTSGLLGVIEKIETTQFCETQPFEGKVIAAPKSGRSNVILTMKCNGTENERGYFLDGTTELKVGSKSGATDKDGIHISGRYQLTSMTFLKIIEVK